MKKLTENIWVMTGLLAVVILGGTGATAYYFISMGRIYTDKAVVSGSITNISPTSAGTLQEVYVNVGDVVGPNTVVARVGNELLKTTGSSVITDTDTAIGTIVSPSTAVVKVVNPDDLHVVAHIDENKG